MHYLMRYLIQKPQVGYRCLLIVLAVNTFVFFSAVWGELLIFPTSSAAFDSPPHPIQNVQNMNLLRARLPQHASSKMTESAVALLRADEWDSFKKEMQGWELNLNITYSKLNTVERGMDEHELFGMVKYIEVNNLSVWRCSVF